MSNRLTGRKRARSELDEDEEMIPFLAYVDKRRDSHRSWSERLDYILVYVVARIIMQLGAEFVLYEQKKSRKNTGIWVEVARFVSEYRDRKTNGAKKEGKHCRERFLNNLSPILSSSEWSGFENRVILEFKYFVGSESPWSELRVIFGNQRCGNEIKNHYNLRLKKLVEKPKKSSHPKKGSRKDREEPLKCRCRSKLELESVHDLEVVHHSNSKDGTKNKKRSVLFQVDFTKKRKKMYLKYKDDNETLTVIPRSSQKPLVRMAATRHSMEDEDDDNDDDEDDFPEEWNRKNYYAYKELNELHRGNLVEWAKEVIVRHHDTLLPENGKMKWFRTKLSGIMKDVDLNEWEGDFDQHFWDSLKNNPLLTSVTAASASGASSSNNIISGHHHHGSSKKTSRNNKKKKMTSIQNRSYEPPSPIQVVSTHPRTSGRRGRRSPRSVMDYPTTAQVLAPPPPLESIANEDDYNPSRRPSPPTTQQNPPHPIVKRKKKKKKKKKSSSPPPLRVEISRSCCSVPQAGSETEYFDYNNYYGEDLMFHRNNNNNNNNTQQQPQPQQYFVNHQQYQDEDDGEEESEEENYFFDGLIVDQLPPFSETEPWIQQQQEQKKVSAMKKMTKMKKNNNSTTSLFPKYMNYPTTTIYYPSTLRLPQQQQKASTSPPQSLTTTTCYQHQQFVAPKTIFIPPPSTARLSPPSMTFTNNNMIHHRQQQQQQQFQGPAPPPNRSFLPVSPPSDYVSEGQQQVAEPRISLFEDDEFGFFKKEEEEEEDSKKKKYDDDDEEEVMSFEHFGIFEKFQQIEEEEEEEEEEEQSVNDIGDLSIKYKNLNLDNNDNDVMVFHNGGDHGLSSMHHNNHDTDVMMSFLLGDELIL